MNSVQMTPELQRMIGLISNGGGGNTSPDFAQWLGTQLGGVNPATLNPTQIDWFQKDYQNKTGQSATGAADTAGMTPFQQAVAALRTSGQPPTLAGIANAWYNTEGKATNAAPWNDPSKPNEATQLAQLQQIYQGELNRYNQMNPTQAPVQASAADLSPNAQTGTPYNPDLVGKGGGFLGSGLGKALLIGGSVALGAGALGAFSGAAGLGGAGLSAGELAAASGGGLGALGGAGAAGLGGAGLTAAELASTSGGGLSSISPEILSAYEGLGYSPQDIEQLMNGTYSGAEQTAAQSASQLGDLNYLTQGSGLPNIPNGATSALQKLLGNVSTGTTGTSALAKLLGVSDSTAQLLGAGGTTLAGLYGANQLKNIADQNRADRAPALNAFNGALANPDSFYKTAPAMGAADAAARALSVQGNPAWNPGLSAKLAANNLGGYNQYLNTLSGPAFGGQATNAALSSNAVNAGTGAVAGGLGNLSTPNTDIATLLKQLTAAGGIGSQIGQLNFSGNA